MYIENVLEFEQQHSIQQILLEEKFNGDSGATGSTRHIRLRRSTRVARECYGGSVVDQGWRLKPPHSLISKIEVQAE
jgi:hypothetical protein